jgi:hypothetical protein|eukprot:COSAG03_NODE_1743_length_3578_cov_2.447255_3_plen_33_part_00
MDHIMVLAAPYSEASIHMIVTHDRIEFMRVHY